MPALGWKHLTDDDKATIARGVRDGVAYGGPYHAEIYPADRCNIDCFFCPTAAIRRNDSTIPRRNERARELDVDSITFNGLGFLKPDQMMSAEQTAEMMRLYEQVVRIDEYRRIAIIDSYEQDIRPMLAEMNARIVAERQSLGTFGRLAHFVTRRDVPMMQKIAHHRRVAKLQKIDR